MHVNAKLSRPKLRRRRPGSCAGKVTVLTRGDLASALKGAHRWAGQYATEREVSRGRSSRKACRRRLYPAPPVKGRTEGRPNTANLRGASPQMPASAGLAQEGRGEAPRVLRSEETPTAGSSLFDQDGAQQTQFHQPSEPPYTDPYVRWWGRGCRATGPPIPIRREARSPYHTPGGKSASKTAAASLSITSPATSGVPTRPMYAA